MGLRRQNSATRSRAFLLDASPGAVSGEMAEHRVAHFRLQSLQVVGLREDGFAQRAGRVAVFSSFFDHEDDLVHVVISEVGRPAASLYTRAMLAFLDYDGTVTTHECNEIVLTRFVGDAWRPLEAEAHADLMSHAKVFDRQIGLIQAPREELLGALVAEAEPAPGLPAFLADTEDGSPPLNAMGGSVASTGGVDPSGRSAETRFFCAARLNDPQVARWREFVERVPRAHYRQDPTWAEIERRDGSGGVPRPIFFWAERDGSFRLTALGLKRSLPLSGRALWEFDKGPTFLDVEALDE